LENLISSQTFSLDWPKVGLIGANRAQTERKHGFQKT